MEGEEEGRGVDGREDPRARVVRSDEPEGRSRANGPAPARGRSDEPARAGEGGGGGGTRRTERTAPRQPKFLRYPVWM